ncbi:MAG: trimethylamine methyltransferase family protein [Granulosicoccaceae bacterium]
MSKADTNAKSRRRRRQRPSTAAIAQLPIRQLRNRFEPVAALDAEQLELVHQASLELLEDMGIEVLGEKALALFRQAGADVGEDGIVCLDRSLVQQCLDNVSGAFTLSSRNPERNILVGENVLNFGLVSGPPNVHDNVNGRRAGNFADYQTLIKLGQSFNVISIFGNQALAPTDLPVDTRHLDTSLCNLTLSDKVFLATGIGAGRAMDAAQMCAIARGVSLEEMALTPSASTNININSPRKLDDAMAYGAMQMSALGQAVVVTPFTLMGAMTPATMAGALVQQNAEALFGVCLTQLVRPGAPVVYGGFTSNVDMRSGAPAFGTPENSLANMAGGQLARKYNLPYRTSACSASNAVDAQAAYETQMALWGAVMGHGNMIYHAAGWMEGGLVASFEKLVVDVEMLQGMSAMLQPLKIDTAEIGLDAMREVGPGGHFFGCEHTMERYKTAFHEPIISDWQNHENWQLAGAKDAHSRATELWQKTVDNFVEPPLDVARKEQLEAYVAKRKEHIGKHKLQWEPEL